MVSRNSFHHEQLGPNKNVRIGVGQHSKTEGLEKIGDPFLIGKNFFETFPDIKRNLSKTFWLKIIDKLPSTWLAPKKRHWKSAFCGSEFLRGTSFGMTKGFFTKVRVGFFFPNKSWSLGALKNHFELCRNSVSLLWRHLNVKWFVQVVPPMEVCLCLP